MKKIFGLAAFLVAAFFAMNGTAFAQPYSCVIVNGQKCYVYISPDGTLDTICDAGSTGSGDFNSENGPIPPKGPVNTTLNPVGINAVVNDDTYGAIRTSLDPSRRSTPATINSLNADQRFPLDVTINFYAQATLDARPGTIYLSRTELQFESREVNSVDPFNAETLRLQNDVDFYDSNDPDQVTVFTLQTGSTSVTLGRHDDAGDGGADGQVR